jgi:hypothetical protein
MIRAFCRHKNHVFSMGVIALGSDEDREGGLGITIEDLNPLTIVSGGSEALDTSKSSLCLKASAHGVKESLTSVKWDA